ncbi:Uncharacterised protein [Shigella sonnei]|nr:Uncharacterised protein [Shigella sonnei]
MRKETRGAFRKTVSGRATQLRLEDGQCAADGLTADFLRAACVGKAN